MNKESLTILIVTFHSENIINNLLKSLKKFNVIIIENSNNINFKNSLEKDYPNVECVLTGQNLGYGSALNVAFRKFKFDNYLILNPDTEITHESIDQIYNKARSNDDIAVLAPSSLNEKKQINKRHGNFKFKKVYTSKNDDLIKVHFVSGHAFLIKHAVLNDVGLFDENYFFNFEEHDLFFRIYEKKYNTFVMKNVYVTHMEGKGSDMKYFEETSLTSKWHYSWGFYYFFKKNYNFFYTLCFAFIYFFVSISKWFYFLIKNDQFKRKLILYSLKGLLASIIGNKSYYRPNIK